MPDSLDRSSADEWWSAPTMTGRLVRIEPLTVDHAPGFLAAAGGPDAADEVFRWLTYPPPRTAADARGLIDAALEHCAARLRLPFAQVDAATGEFIGSTSYYEIDPIQHSLAIGHTWLGRRWWRTGHNTDSKLLMLSRAFDDLGAVGVGWHADSRNERSCTAIARLGATREATLRKHKMRRDGTWRDTALFSMLDEEWPSAREAMRSRQRAQGG
jgi:RimJ/RimL family protein N-acetyltransferase